jgi:hypothetical protein
MWVMRASERPFSARPTAAILGGPYVADMPHESFRRCALGAALLLLLPLSGCGNGEATSESDRDIQVAGIILTNMSVEQLGGTGLTQLLMINNPAKFDEFLRGSVGQSCAMSSPNLSGAEVLIEDADGTTVAVGHVAGDATIKSGGTNDQGFLYDVDCGTLMSPTFPKRTACTRCPSTAARRSTSRRMT